MLLFCLAAGAGWVLPAPFLLPALPCTPLREARNAAMPVSSSSSSSSANDGFTLPCLTLLRLISGIQAGPTEGSQCSAPPSS